ncbi:MAG: nucleotidyltransferase family protein [Bacteroidales bacterium]
MKKRMTESIKDQLFELIKAALWDVAPNENLFERLTHDQWEELYRLAVGGAVVSLGYDGLNRLPDGCLPVRTVLLKWYALSEKKKEHNNLCKKVLQQITLLYGKNDVEFILLKGLGVAQLYRNPSFRDGGDIDLLITKNYDLANELMRKGGCIKSDDNIKHRTFTYKRVTVENHHSVAINSVTGKVLEPLFVNPKVIFGSVLVPNATCNSVYLVEHIADHFFIGGIGLRHICDLCMLFSKGGIDLQESREGITKIGAAPLFARLAAIMVRHLGVDQALLPIEPVYDRLTDKVLQDIVTRGNFGSMEQWQISKNKWVRKSKTMGRIVKRIWSYRKLGGAIYFQHIKDLLAFNFKSMTAGGSKE